MRKYGFERLRRRWSRAIRDGGYVRSKAIRETFTEYRRRSVERSGENAKPKSKNKSERDHSAEHKALDGGAARYNRRKRRVGSGYGRDVVHVREAYPECEEPGHARDVWAIRLTRDYVRFPQTSPSRAPAKRSQEPFFDDCRFFDAREFVGR